MLLAVGLLVVPWPARAAETPTRIRAVLIWGTNEPKPEGAKLKDLDAQTRKKLKAVFKWKDYYEVTRKDFAASKKPDEKVRLSDKCQVAVQDLGESAVEVKLYGEGKLVVTKRQIMKPGELLVLAGEDKNDTAWFVAMTLAPPAGEATEPEGGKR
jgi:hypothetical protein